MSHRITLKILKIVPACSSKIWTLDVNHSWTSRSNKQKPQVSLCLILLLDCAMLLNVRSFRKPSHGESRPNRSWSEPVSWPWRSCHEVWTRPVFLMEQKALLLAPQLVQCRCLAWWIEFWWMPIRSVLNCCQQILTLDLSRFDYRLS